MNVAQFVVKTTKGYRFYVGILIFVMFLLALDANFKPFLIKLLIDTATGVDHYNVWNLVLVYIALQILLNLSWTCSDWCVAYFKPKYLASIAQTLTEQVGSYKYVFFQNSLPGSIIAKINDVSSNAPQILFNTIYFFVKFFLTAVITIALLCYVNMFFGISLIVWLMFFFVIHYLFSSKLIKYAKVAAEAKTHIWGQVADYITNIISVRLFTNQSFESARLTLRAADYVEKAKSQDLFLMRFYLIQGILTSIYVVAFISCLVIFKQRNLITAGDFALVFMLNFRMFDNLFELSDRLRDFLSSWGSVAQGLISLQQPGYIEIDKGTSQLHVAKGVIVFDKVDFEYHGMEKLFSDKSVTIEAGQKVGLVGYSGSGKTTFVNLILRLYDVTAGKILIDGQDIATVMQDSLRQAISIIPQEPLLFHRSILENIRYGNIHASDQEVIQAAKQAHAHEFIVNLPQAYESHVGDRGVKLSGGQRQRIAIARAILKNAPIIILDEATSQLDSIIEGNIQESLWNLTEGKTTIIIAHRLSTLLQMNNILVFDRGKIVENGTHAELLKAGKLYKSLWDAQIGGFLPQLL